MGSVHFFLFFLFFLIFLIFSKNSKKKRPYIFLEFLEIRGSGF